MEENHSLHLDREPFTWRQIALVLLWSAALIGWCFFASWRMSTWLDEGLYNYKGWLFITGHFTAYKDIWTEYPPLAFFPIGIAQVLFGPGMMVGRIFGSICFLIGTTFVSLTAYRFAGPRAMVLAIFLSLAHVFSAAYFCTGTPYAQTMMLCAISIYALSSPKKSFLNTSIASVCAVLAALTFANMVLFFIGVIAYILFDRGKKLTLISLGAALAVALAILLPFATRFSNLILAYRPGKIYEGVQSAYPVYTPFSFPSEISLIARFAVVFSPFLLLLIVGFFSAPEPESKSAFSKNRRRMITFMIIWFFVMVAVSAWGSGLTWRMHYTRYAIYYLPLLLIPSAVVGSRFLQKRPALISFFLVITLLASLLLSAPRWLRNKGSDLTDMQRLKQVGQTLAEYTKPDDLVFAYGAPQILLEAQRVGFAPMINREYTMGFNRKAWELEKINFYHPTMATQWIEKEADAVYLNYLGHMHFIHPKASATTDTFTRSINKHFYEAKAIYPGDFTQFGARPVGIYLRKTDDLKGASLSVQENDKH